MTISEAENFYKQDNEDYELHRNKDFLNWLDNAINEGYHCYIGINELQALINSIANWYEIKYPERELDDYKVSYIDFLNNNKKLSEVMNVKQLLFRLPHKQLSIMQCAYRANGGGQEPVYVDGKLVNWKSYIFMKIKRNNHEENTYSFNVTPYFLILANEVTGEVENNDDIKDYIKTNKKLYLNNLLEVFKKNYSKELDFSSLEECINNHNCDIEIRYYILKLVALKLLYSKNTSPENGYKRAKIFIDEINRDFNINLSTDEIDEIMQRNYNDEEKGIKNLVKKMLDNKKK